MKSVTRLERVRAAIELRASDRAPVTLHNFQTAARATGLPLREVFRDGELLAEAMLKAWREFGHDMILLENGTACNAEACGAKVAYPEHSGSVVDKPLISSLAEVHKLQVPDPYRTFPMCEVIKATRILAKEAGRSVWICARADQGPMSLAAQLRGLDTFMMDLALGEEPELIHALLDFSRRVATRYALALVECGAHSTCFGDSASGPELLSPKHYRQFPWRHQKRMAEELRQRGVILHSHICGNTGPITKEFVALGAQVLEVDHKTEPRRLKRAARGKVCLLGNIDTTMMAFGTPAEIDTACEELIKSWRPDNGFILGPGCALGPQVPSDNIQALVEAAKRHSNC